MDSELELWVIARAGGIVSAQSAWKQALEYSISAGWSASEIQFFGDRFQNAASLSKLCESASLKEERPEGSLRELIEARSDSSRFSLDEWISALEILLQYLIKEGRKADLATQLGYLNCSAEYLAKGVSPLSFPVAVEGFIDQFGFEG